jgi:hypothetical protein
MELKSLIAKGCIWEHLQSSTLQRLRVTHTKNWESSPLGVAEGASFTRGLGRIQPTLCPSQSEWFYDFLRVMEYRMGCQLQPKDGLLVGAIVHLLVLINEDAKEAKCLGFITKPNMGGVKHWTLTIYCYKHISIQRTFLFTLKLRYVYSRLMLQLLCKHKLLLLGLSIGRYHLVTA